MLFLSFQIFQDLYDDTVFSFKYFKAEERFVKERLYIFLRDTERKTRNVGKNCMKAGYDFPILKGEN